MSSDTSRNEQSERPVVVVTGATFGGLGHGICKVLAHHGWYVFGTVRNDRDAARLSDDLASTDAFSTLLLDVTDKASIVRGADQVAKYLKGRRLTALVNNSGISIQGPAMFMDLDETRQVMEVNYFGAIMVTQAFLPLMTRSPSENKAEKTTAKIMMVSSVNGKITYPFHGAYSASKHALEGYSGALRKELLPYDIEVIVFAPGGIKTAIWDKCIGGKGVREKYARTPYYRAFPKFCDVAWKLAFVGHTPEKQGRKVLKLLNARRPQLRVAYVHNKFSQWYVHRLAPERIINYVTAQKTDLTHKAFWGEKQ